MTQLFLRPPRTRQRLWASRVRDEAKIEQKRFDNRVQRLSFDRGFHSPGNQEQLSELVTQLCLPKPGAKQSVKQLADADDDFLAAKQNHSGIESAIGAMQSGNACGQKIELLRSTANSAC